MQKVTEIKTGNDQQLTAKIDISPLHVGEMLVCQCYARGKYVGPEVDAGIRLDLAIDGEVLVVDQSLETHATDHEFHAQAYYFIHLNSGQHMVTNANLSRLGSGAALVTDLYLRHEVFGIIAQDT